MSSTKSTGLRLFRQGGLYTLGLFLMRGGNFLLLPLYTALLTREEYGTFGVVKHLVNFLVILAIAGQSHALLRFGTDAEGDEAATGRLLSSVFTYVAAAAVVLSLGTALGWSWLGEKLDGIPLWPVGAAGIVLLAAEAGFRLVLSWLQFRGEAKVHTQLSLARWVVMMALIVLFLVGFEWKAEGLLLAAGLSFAAGAAVGVRRLRPQGLRFRIHPGTLKATLIYGLPILPHAMAGIIFQATDQVLLAAHDDYGLDVAGVYLLAAQLAGAVFMIAMGMQRAWLPFFLRADRDRERDGWHQVRVLSFFSVTAVACAAVGVGLLAPEIVALASAFASGRYAPAAAVVPILALGGFIRSYYLVVVAVMMSNRKLARWIAAATLPAAALNLWLNMLWIPEYGMYGAAWATVTSHGVTLLLAGTLARIARKVPFKYGKATALAVLVVGALYLGTDEPLALRLGLIAGFGAAVVLLDSRDIRSAARSLRRNSESAP